MKEFKHWLIYVIATFLLSPIVQAQQTVDITALVKVFASHEQPNENPITHNTTLNETIKRIETYT